MAKNSKSDSVNGSKSVHNDVLDPKKDSRLQTRGPSVNPGTKTRSGVRGK